MGSNPRCFVTAKMRFALFIPLLLLIDGVFGLQANAQQIGDIKLALDENPVSLIAEDVNLPALVYLRVGQTIRYLVRSAKEYEKGLIIGITDSTISFQNKKSGNRTIQLVELISLKVPRSTVRKVAGAGLTAYGAAIMVGGVVIVAQSIALSDQDQAVPLVFYILGAVLAEGLGYIVLKIGTILLKARQIDLPTPWELHPTHAIIPGNVIRVILKDGHVVNKMKVRSITADKIIGNEQAVDSQGNHVRKSNVILIANILECSRIK